MLTIGVLSFLVAISMLPKSALAQIVSKPIQKVEITINTPDYQMAYLADFIDVRAQRLSPTIAGVSVDIDVVEPAGGSGLLSLDAVIMLQLQGENSSSVLVKGRTNKFTVLNGHRTLTARDFVSKDVGREIRMLDEYYYENTRLRKKLEDLAQATATVPPGIYKILLTAFNGLGREVGKAEKTIVISRGNVEETVVEIVEPANGSILTTLTPTFTWTTTANEVILRVFEAGRNHRSAQDAVTAAKPFLVRKVSGTTTLTYPADAERKLEQEKVYVLQISALITTNRGVVERPGKPVVFRITADRVGAILDKFFNSQSSDVAASYTTLRSQPTNWVPWQAYGSIMLDGKIISEGELEAILNAVSQEPNANVTLQVENQ